MKKPIALFAFASMAFNAQASHLNLNAGSSFTLGPSSNEHSLYSGAFNPAMGMLMVKDLESWRFGFLPSISTQVEFGQVDEFSDELENLIDVVDNAASTTDPVNVTLTRFNKVLVAMGKEGYFKDTSSIRLPLFYYSDIAGGVLSGDFSYEVQASARILDDTLFYNQQNSTFSTNTSVYLKSGLESDASLAYSHQLLGGDSIISPYGKLYGGVKLSLIHLQLSKQVDWVESLLHHKIKDIVKDEYDQNLVSSQNASVDLGLEWDAKTYRLGLTLNNINSPKFAYNTVGMDCEKKTAGSVASSNCYMAKYFVETKNKLNAREVHTKNALMTIDGLYKITDQWRIMSSVDMGKYNDVVGFDKQQFVFATAYETQHVWLPSPRLAYQKNLAGEKLSSANIGFTLLNLITFDVAYGLNNTVVDGKKVPRLMGFSFGFEEKF